MDKLTKLIRVHSAALTSYALSNDELQYLDVDLVQQELMTKLTVKVLGEKNGN